MNYNKNDTQQYSTKNIKKKKLDAIDSFYPIIIHDWVKLIACDLFFAPKNMTPSSGRQHNWLHGTK